MFSILLWAGSNEKSFYPFAGFQHPYIACSHIHCTEWDKGAHEIFSDASRFLYHSFDFGKLVDVPVSVLKSRMISNVAEKQRRGRMRTRIYRMPISAQFSGI
jgi:hypothetical protein